MPPDAKRARPVLRRIGFDPALVACVAALLAFPVLAWMAAAGQPLEPPRQAPVSVPSGGDSDARRLRDVPVFEHELNFDAALASQDEMRDALRAGMTDLLDAVAARRLLRLVESKTTTEIEGGDSVDSMPVPYPYRYADIDRLLPTAFTDTARANDLGALLILASARFGGADSLDPPFPNAGFAAFAVLNRARAGGGCAPQLNLAFLLSADRTPRDDDVAREYQLAADRCGGDPTPLWLLTQFQSQRAFIRDNVKRPGQQLRREDRLRRPFVTARALQRTDRRLAAAWAAEADAELRIGYQMDPLQPFGSRQRFRRALALYRAARRLDVGDPELAVGEARALAGLHRYRRAATVQQAASAKLDGIAPVQARLIEYLERAGRFSAAAEAAAALETSHEFPPSRSLLMKVAHDDGEQRLPSEDAEGPVSTGVARTRPVRINVGPFPGGVGGPGADVSFIPLFRSVSGVTGHDRWCPGWARRRDLVLAGRAREALDGMPGAFADVNPDNDTRTCSSGIPTLAGLASLEAGDRAGAVSRLRQRDATMMLDGREPIAALRDAQQNLWRFARDYERAASAAAAWVREYPDDPDAMDRAGEIAFLDGRHADAARWFGRETLATRSVHGVWTAYEARAQLKRGTALSRLDRQEEALELLTDAEETALRAGAFAKENNDYEAEAESEFYAYHALAQAGDAALLAKRYDDASERYAVAAEFVPRLADLPIDREPLARPEVLFNNWALAETQAGRPAAALVAARKAVAVDPANPLFRDTEGFALQRVGRAGEAVGSYRAAVASDPSDFPAWNNLGVALDDRSAAVVALRRAVGARDEYALGWFNLGVALERQGPLHALASQGALGRAIRLDKGLRDREHDAVIDDEVYVTNLDLSKPLPPKWELSRTQERAPAAAASFALALLLGLRLARLLAGQGATSGRPLYEAVRAWIDRLPPRLRLPRAAIAVVSTIAVFLLPVLLSGTASLTGTLLVALGTGLLIAAVLRARVLVARRAGVGLEQRTWSPGVAFGLMTGALGAPWAPLPVARTSRPAAAIHWVGPLLTGLLALALLVLSALLEIPVTRSLGAAALVMAASLLTPIEPLDGGVVAKSPVGTVTTLAVLGAAVLVLIGLG